MNQVEWDERLFGAKPDCNCASSDAEVGTWWGPARDGLNHRPWCPVALLSGSGWDEDRKRHEERRVDVAALRALAIDLRARADHSEQNGYPAIVWPLTPDKARAYAALFEKFTK